MALPPKQIPRDALKKLIELILQLEDVNGIEEVVLPVIEVVENNIVCYFINTL
jgi:hypothetical protein